MEFTLFNELSEQFGYLSMFLFSWLLFFGLPLPNELAAAFSGMMSTDPSYNTVIAFTSTYLGLISSASAAYGIGRLLGPKIEHLIKKSKLHTKWDRGISFINRFGGWAIALSFFVPGVRWVMPYIAGVTKQRFWQFCLFAYPAAFIWAMIYFQIGRAFPLIYPDIIENLKYIVPASAVLLGTVLFFSQARKRTIKQKENGSL
ncbi:DedA family protein [Jeotgalibacillus sp. S-D1]|uniref:DedA family protein n=1 Tax=Jeotgalibacillus sp. S-D1 TaxID=2552189 RepID=UPI00105A9CA5|nr:DedA family protein [Jeotgalibacillus sp. S-D1]TDL34861.1 DedA family protein [Jeotgalibacillus sp. S-D1]